ncbi:MAG TPA: hypothetical protein VGF67_10185 [Ktedonobacteraceae bacterium]|jgi:hypothetical protein
MSVLSLALRDRRLCAGPTIQLRLVGVHMNLHQGRALDETCPVRRPEAHILHTIPPIVIAGYRQAHVGNCAARGGV